MSWFEKLLPSLAEQTLARAEAAFAEQRLDERLATSGELADLTKRAGGADARRRCGAPRSRRARPRHPLPARH